MIHFNFLSPALAFSLFRVYRQTCRYSKWRSRVCVDVIVILNGLEMNWNVIAKWVKIWINLFLYLYIWFKWTWTLLMYTISWWIFLSLVDKRLSFMFIEFIFLLYTLRISQGNIAVKEIIKFNDIRECHRFWRISILFFSFQIAHVGDAISRIRLTGVHK